jgi:hypothetical protein
MSEIRQHQPIAPEVEGWARQVIDSAYKVHSVLGPGLIESVYEACLAHDLGRRGIKVETQVGPGSADRRT